MTETTEVFRIAIDGPAGAGKSTISALLAESLGFIHINTGILYRAISYFILKELPIPVEEIEKKIIKKSTDISKIVDSFLPEIKNNQVFLENKNITDQLRTSKIDKTVGIISKYKIIRDKIKIIQKNLIFSNSLVVVEGRDIGTAVIPNAELKIYLEASVEARAERRKNETQKTIEEIKREIKERDYLDMNREISPLIRAEDAVVIDSTNLTVDETVRKIQGIVFERRK